jgi:hypothetical protein
VQDLLVVAFFARDLIGVDHDVKDLAVVAHVGVDQDLEKKFRNSSQKSSQKYFTKKFK